MSQRLYVYYRVPAHALADTLAAARAMQSALTQAHAGLAAELLRRPGANDAEVTLMETYRNAAGIDAALEAAISAAARVHALPAERHVEHFVPL